MNLLKVKTKFQVTLPPEARTVLGVKEGDVLGVVVEAATGRIVLTPKVIVDKRAAEATPVAKATVPYRIYSPAELKQFLQADQL